MEFSKELNTQFNCWCNSLGVHTYEALCELIILEQFKNSISSHIATYINERKEKMAATPADEYVLTHCSDHECRTQDDAWYRRGW